MHAPSVLGADAHTACLTGTARMTVKAGPRCALYGTIKRIQKLLNILDSRVYRIIIEPCGRATNG